MSKVVESVEAYVVKAAKSRDSTVQTPSKWATAAGFEGSAASPLRQHIARASGNGCGRKGRYPAVDAAGMLELIQLGHQYAEADGAKAQSVAKRIAVKVKSSTKSGAKAAKTSAKGSRTKTAA